MSEAELRIIREIADLRTLQASEAILIQIAPAFFMWSSLILQSPLPR